VKFVIAGAGDESSRLVELAASLGIGHRVLFAGFLRGRDVDRVFRMADVYVMPSVSEPFGLAPLEAAARGVPVIVSRQAGVSEVLTHALRADFWDTRELAGLILSVLRRPSLAESLRDHAAVQVRSITWDRSARRCQAVYRQALALMPY
jgi:glycosyltransferase involved in cell wall biosynthesis